MNDTTVSSSGELTVDADTFTLDGTLEFSCDGSTLASCDFASFSGAQEEIDESCGFI